MSIVKKVKSNARMMLKGKLGAGAAITLFSLGVWLIFYLLEIIVSMIFNADSLYTLSGIVSSPEEFVQLIPTQTYIGLGITAVITIVYLFVSSPLSVGIKGWYFTSAGGDKPELRSMFNMFTGKSRFFGSIWLKVTIALRVFAVSVLSLLPGAAAFTAGIMALTAKISAPNASAAGLALVISGAGLVLFAIGFIIMFSMRYFAAVYLFCEDEAVSVKVSIKQSVKYMKGMKGGLLTLYLSYIPLTLLSCLLFTLPFLYTVPYFEGAKALYAKVAIEKGRQIEADEEICLAAKNDQAVLAPRKPLEGGAGSI